MTAFLTLLLQTTLLAFGLLKFTPLNTHRGIWYDVAACLEVAAPRPDAFAWFVADSIISEDGMYAYGMTSFPASGTPSIILERAYALNTAVISHEVIHVLTHDTTHVGPAWECVMDDGVFLPVRQREAEGASTYITTATR